MGSGTISSLLIMLNAFLISIILMFSLSAYAKDIKLCKTLEVHSGDLFDFSKTERLFLCGDSDSAPWADPSDTQVKLFMSSFLQSRGYFQPVFRREGETLIVETGPLSRVRSLASENVPLELDFKRFWVPSRKALMPSLLDEYQDLVRGRIEAEGYPCPSVKATADATDGSMTLNAEPGPRQRVHTIEESGNKSLREGTLRRYFPIREGDWFNGDLVHIANERIKTAEILSGSYMVSTCEEKGATIHHRVVTGPTRRMTVGVGVNTETYLIARTTYHSARLDPNASSFDARLSANYFRQSIDSNFEWYFLSTPSPLHFKPALEFERRSEESVDERSTKASWYLGSYGDIGSQFLRGYIGPNLNLVRTLRGIGPDFARILEIEANGRIMSHNYEFYRSAPRTGYILDWRYTTASDRTYSTLAVRTYSAKGEILFNFAGMEPPLLVFGIRANVATSDAASDIELPDQYLYYIGGSDSVRGFKRRTVPSTIKGARTLGTGGLELRLLTIIPFSLQPFVFFDVGQLGNKAFSYEPTIYYSPGLGVRWQSPFGSLRGSVARGRVQTTDAENAEAFSPRWNAFVSFGEEF